MEDKFSYMQSLVNSLEDVSTKSLSRKHLKIIRNSIILHFISLILFILSLVPSTFSTFLFFTSIIGFIILPWIFLSSLYELLRLIVYETDTFNVED